MERLAIWVLDVSEFHHHRIDHSERPPPGLPRWREALFALMHHNAQRPGAYFKIPGGQIMEIGVEFEI